MAEFSAGRNPHRGHVTFCLVVFCDLIFSQASGVASREGRVVEARFFHPLLVHAKGVFFLGDSGVGPPP